MNTSKIALYTDNDDKKTFTLTPAETIAEMFEYTDENGVLYFPIWDEDEINAEPQICRCVMDWTRDDAEEVIAEHAGLAESLEKIAANTDVSGDILSPHFAVHLDVLSSQLMDVWNRFLDPDMNENDVIYRSRRLLKLFALKAPKAVINHESCLLAQAMAVHKYGKSMEIVEEVQ